MERKGKQKEGGLGRGDGCRTVKIQLALEQHRS